MKLIRVLAVLTGAWVAGLSLPASAQVVSLGEAANYVVLGNDVNLHHVNVYGDVGVGPNGKVKIGAPSTVYGDVYLNGPLDPATASGAGTVTGSIFTDADVAQALSDAWGASTLAAGLTPDYTFASITGSTTITGIGGQTVVNVLGDVLLTSGENLLFSGAPEDRFIVNIFGTLTLEGNAMIGGTIDLQGLGWVDSSDVLLNIVGTGSKVTSSLYNMVYGTALGLEREFEFHGVAGALIGGDEEMKLVDCATLTHVPYCPVPEPSGAALVLAAGLFLLLIRQRRGVWKSREEWRPMQGR